MDNLNIREGIIHMACIVQKYGGSSVADIEKLKKIAQIIAAVKKQNVDVAVVVSAMGKTTDKLVEMAREFSSTPSRREMDMLLSTGERITMALLCIALHELGIEAVSLTGSQSGIITDDRHNNARVIEVRPFRVQDELDKGKVVVISGFQGVSYKREITTLGRGGSDTTAVALAAALDAERCEIYSDVDGVYTADPSAVAEAKHLPELSYPVMQEMSTAGAKVLNAHAVQFAKEKQIAIYTRSTFKPGKETIVRKLTPDALTGVQVVVSEKDLTQVRIHGEHALRNFEWTLGYLEDENVAIKELHVAEITTNVAHSKTSFIVSQKNVYNWEQIKEKLSEKMGDTIAFDTHLSALSLIGEGLNKSNDILYETIELLRAKDIRIAGITTTSFRISLLVSKEDIEKSVQLCHDKWVQG
jgi:aspartate kinase